VAYNPNILRDVLRARSLTLGQLSERLGMERKNLEHELQSTPEPKQGILNNIAKELALPPFMFFMKEAPPLHDVIPDYRSSTPSPSAKLRGTIESIQFAEGIQKAATELDASTVANLPLFPAPPDNVGEFALRARSFFEITMKDRADAKNVRAFYSICRKRIEDKGIFVLHDSFPETDGSGFCLWHPKHPIIVVNTKQQTRGRMLFSLFMSLPMS
jgi:transcriptional regulator with XRE-family HTH domain